MKKPAFQVYLERIMQEQRAASDKARIAYEQSGDPQVVIGYIKHSLSGAAIKEPWVILTIQNWICSDRGDLLKQAFLTRRGERRKPRKHALDSMMFVTRIDKLRKAGKALNEALICELERTGGGDLEGDKLSRELRKLKKSQTERQNKDAFRHIFIRPERWGQWWRFSARQILWQGQRILKPYATSFRCRLLP